LTKKTSLTLDQKIAQTTIPLEDEYINFYDYQEVFNLVQGDVSEPTSPKATHTSASFRATRVPSSPASARINFANFPREIHTPRIAIPRSSESLLAV